MDRISSALFPQWFMYCSPIFLSMHPFSLFIVRCRTSVRLYFFHYRVNFPGAHWNIILRNFCSQSEIFHPYRNAPTAPKSWLSALPAASAPIYGVAGRESRLRSRWKISNWLLELRNIIAQCAPGKFTLQRKKITGHLFCNERYATTYVRPNVSKLRFGFCLQCRSDKSPDVGVGLVKSMHVSSAARDEEGRKSSHLTALCFWIF